MGKPAIAILRPDRKGRITLGRLAQDVSSFRAVREPDGRILLEPFVEIPAREQWLFQSKKALASVKRGLAQSKAGKTESLGSFARYADDEVE